MINITLDLICGYKHTEYPIPSLILEARNAAADVFTLGPGEGLHQILDRTTYDWAMLVVCVNTGHITKHESLIGCFRRNFSMWTVE